MKYEVQSPLLFNGHRYEKGEFVEMTEKSASVLLEDGIIKLTEKGSKEVDLDEAPVAETPAEQPSEEVNEKPKEAAPKTVKPKNKKK